MRVAFSEILEIKNGKNQRQVENPKGQYPIYGSGGVMGYANSYICGAETVVIGRKGSINNPIFVEEPFWNVDTAFGLVANRNVLLPKYLYYFCKQFDFVKLNTTVTIPSLTKANLLQIEMSLVCLEKQEEVISVLDKITELMAVRVQQLEELDLLVKSRFVEMFGDMSSSQWESKRLDEIATTRLGKMLDAKRQTGLCTYPYLANFNVQWFGFNLERLNEMDFDEADREEFSLSEGDLLICEGGEVGRTAIWRGNRSNCYFQKALHRVRCNSELCVPEYIAWVMYFKAHSGQFDGIASAATIAHLPGVKLKALMFPLPPLTLQNEFADFVRQTDKSKFEIQQGLKQLELQYSALMQQYFG